MSSFTVHHNPTAHYSHRSLTIYTSLLQSRRSHLPLISHGNEHKNKVSPVSLNPPVRSDVYRVIDSSALGQPPDKAYARAGICNGPCGRLSAVRCRLQSPARLNGVQSLYV